MDKKLFNKSLEELENDFWEITEFPTALIEKCYYARKKMLKDLSPEDLRILTTQSIGLKYIIPLCLEVLQKDILIDSSFYKGDLLESVLKLPSSFWKEDNNFILWKQYIKLVESKKDYISNACDVNSEIKNDILKAYLNFEQIFF